MMYYNRWNHDIHRPSYPEVDAQLFHESSLAFKPLISDAELLTNALADDQSLTHDIMAAAQVNDKDRVMSLIYSTGIQGDVDVTFNPSSITINMSSKTSGVDCCKLKMTIRWG